MAKYIVEISPWDDIPFTVEAKAVEVKERVLMLLVEPKNSEGEMGRAVYYPVEALTTFTVVQKY